MYQAAIHRKPQKSSANLFAALLLACVVCLYVFSNYAPGTIFHHPKLQLFKTMFLSIIIEAMPFILIGVFISAILQVFVSERAIRRIIPRNPLLGILTASVLGIIFPICECGMVPAIRKLIRKGMPIHVATTFILVGPILNPIVFWSTLTAFRNRPEMVYTRMGLAFIVALLIGLIVYRFVKSNPLRWSEKDSVLGEDNHHHDHSPEGTNKLVSVMGHAIEEFFEMGKYLMFGAFLVGILQTFVSQDSLVAVGQGEGSANLLMMGLGFLLSLCSTSDAFVAQSFISTFSKGSLIAFMVFGPMLNLKGLLMMLAVFKTKFVVFLSLLIIIFVYAGSLILEYTVLK
ncbi:permease [Paenibacillus alginolyticus]|uniref:Permease n=1 Tax=Paenibacillus alginolyticus TaxID=59839 RepID=A0ABT4GG93_9BACL|nr:permease [Paenibacillus alginolyticus]MCY9695218.1 permease [Paenibacillus alginolyticus]MEC0145175.1 permease [Paenibacillus alginolyticus]